MLDTALPQPGYASDTYLYRCIRGPHSRSCLSNRYLHINNRILIVMTQEMRKTNLAVLGSGKGNPTF
jgi:hypothetical protein